MENFVKRVQIQNSFSDDSVYEDFQSKNNTTKQAVKSHMDWQFIKSNRRKRPTGTNMCVLPNLPSRDLEELSQRRKSQIKKAEAKKLDIIVADLQPSKTQLNSRIKWSGPGGI